VDANVTRHVPAALAAAADWDVLILHYLGVDHLGHTDGRGSTRMLAKLREMDAVVAQLWHTLSTTPRALLAVVSDHGMTEARQRPRPYAFLCLGVRVCVCVCVNPADTLSV
jgi:ethanolamine phosphate transferase 2 subunit G